MKRDLYGWLLLAIQRVSTPNLRGSKSIACFSFLPEGANQCQVSGRSRQIPGDNEDCEFVTFLSALKWRSVPVYGRQMSTDAERQAVGEAR